MFTSLSEWRLMKQAHLAPFQYKDHVSRYGYFQHKDKMVMRTSQLYDKNSYTSKAVSLLFIPCLHCPIYSLIEGSWVLHGAHLGPTGPRWAHVGPMIPVIWVDKPIFCFGWTQRGGVKSHNSFMRIIYYSKHHQSRCHTVSSVTSITGPLQCGCHYET